MLKFLSVCSGIEAASVAWNPLGFKAVGFSEIEPFPCALLKHHYPNVTNFGDMTGYKEWQVEPFDILVGGTPCQAFSVAGLRKGLDDPRGNLTLVFLGMIDFFKPRYVVWENVPGVLSDKTGAFDQLLSGFNELGYVLDTDILDAQFFGVPQRRRRVFVTAVRADFINSSFKEEEHERFTDGEIFSGEELCQGKYNKLWQASDKVNSLFNPATLYRGGHGQIHTEHDSLYGDTSEGAERGETTAAGTESLSGEEVRVFPRQGITGFSPASDVAGCLLASDCKGRDRGNIVLYKTHPSDSRVTECKNGTSDTVTTRYGTGGGNTPLVLDGSVLRKLTPVECERLQGFPDNYTRIPYREKAACDCSDNLRYKALGNSMAVPVMSYIGRRIAFLEEGLNHGGKK